MSTVTDMGSLTQKERTLLQCCEEAYGLCRKLHMLSEDMKEEVGRGGPVATILKLLKRKAEYAVRLREKIRQFSSLMEGCRTQERTLFSEHLDRMRWELAKAIRDAEEEWHLWSRKGSRAGRGHL